LSIILALLVGAVDITVMAWLLGVASGASLEQAILVIEAQ
jgi:hypothetical protein